MKWNVLAVAALAAAVIALPAEAHPNGPGPDPYYDNYRGQQYGQGSGYYRERGQGVRRSSGYRQSSGYVVRRVVRTRVCVRVNSWGYEYRVPCRRPPAYRGW